MEVNPSTVSLPLIRNLASCNTPSRSKALRDVITWLPTQTHIPEQELLKLWKGLFYSMWHSDKTPVQHNLIEKISSLLLTLNVDSSLQYLSAFLVTMRREWSGIDVLRLDKFYLLIRRFVNYSFNLLKKNAWDVELTKSVMSVYEEKTMLANEMKFLGNGVNYHISSVFLDEVKGYMPVGREACEVLFRPFLVVMSVSNDKVLVGKIRNCVFERLLSMGKRLLEVKKNGEEVEDLEVVNLGTIALKMGFGGKFYELGSSSECLQGNRKVLFGLNKEFLKLEKELESSGVEVEFSDVVDCDGDEEVPELVPIVDSGLLLEGAENGGDGEKKSKKKKKKKKKNKAVKEGSGSDGQDCEMKENDNGNVNDNGIISDGNDVTFTELFKSNLQMEFEKVADEDGLNKDGEATITVTKPKKRKRVRSADARESHNTDVTEQGGTAMKSGEKSAKKVRFSIKNNLVWKPQSPLPPQSLRIPPSSTPRGSALKKGVPPGPIREMPPAGKRVKKKKVRKVMKTTSPAIKRLRKLQTLSTE
nr:ribosomal RNA processing protein 1 homolog [Tanacetum cinerariifolium]GEW15324.1 ribosomal RNA processing protein 1 homolog [Tanacetum cinerariifolium]